MARTVFYTTIENQIRPDGSRGLLFDHYDDLDAALAKLYTVLAAAAVSGIPYHSGHILRSDGILIEGRVFDRRPVEEPEPEPEDNHETVEGEEGG